MLARPEPGTKEHILLWLASKPQDEPYHWSNPHFCACGQYEQEMWGVPLCDRKAGQPGPTPEGHVLLWGPRRCTWKGRAPLNSLAFECQSRTFGELYELAQKVWA